MLTAPGISNKDYQQQQKFKPEMSYYSPSAEIATRIRRPSPTTASAAAANDDSAANNVLFQTKLKFVQKIDKGIEQADRESSIFPPIYKNSSNLNSYHSGQNKLIKMDMKSKSRNRKANTKISQTKVRIEHQPLEE